MINFTFMQSVNQHLSMYCTSDAVLGARVQQWTKQAIAVLEI